MHFLAMALVFIQDFPLDVEPNYSGYLCIAENSTGFNWSESRGWHQTNFRIDASRYIFRPARESETVGDLDWVWVDFGRTGAIAIRARCNSSEFYANWSICGAGNQFKFNFLTLRYVRTATTGYPTEFLAERTLELDGLSEFRREYNEREVNSGIPPDSMVIEIGECSPI